MLLWTEKPNANECQKVGVDSGKFFCGQKGKFGLNLLGVCDSMCRFTYISIQHPASASDYLAFVTSSLYVQFTEGEGLPKGFCLYVISINKLIHLFLSSFFIVLIMKVIKHPMA